MNIFLNECGHQNHLIETKYIILNKDTSIKSAVYEAVNFSKI